MLMAEEFKKRGMSAAEFARVDSAYQPTITGILDGKSSITGDTSFRLAHLSGTSAEFWLNLQSLFELRTVRKRVGNSLNALPRVKRAERDPA